MKDLGVLVVHDNEEALSVIIRMFSHFKIRVDCVGSTTAAFDRLKTKEYRMMITDLAQSKLKRIELARKAQELFPKLNVILFSGKSKEQIIRLALDPKVSDISEVHHKPCGLGDMLKVIMNKEIGKIYLLE